MRGQLAQQRGDYDEAKRLFEETLSLGEMRIVLLDLGDLNLELGKLDLAKEYCHKALKLAKQNKDKSDLRAQVTCDLGRIALGYKEWATAGRWFSDRHSHWRRSLDV
jgi:tetratricopeptide (TPR) repeat protein